MTTGGEIWVLNKLNELTLRLGLIPSQIELQLNCVDDTTYRLDFCTVTVRPGDEPKVDRLLHLLGMDKGIVKSNDLEDINVIVDRALAVTPPLWVHSR